MFGPVKLELDVRVLDSMPTETRATLDAEFEANVRPKVAKLFRRAGWWRDTEGNDISPAARQFLEAEQGTYKIEGGVLYEKTEAGKYVEVAQVGDGVGDGGALAKVRDVGVQPPVFKGLRHGEKMGLWTWDADMKKWRRGLGGRAAKHQEGTHWRCRTCCWTRRWTRKEEAKGEGFQASCPCCGENSPDGLECTVLTQAERSQVKDDHRQWKEQRRESKRKAVGAAGAGGPGAGASANGAGSGSRSGREAGSNAPGGDGGAAAGAVGP